MPFRGPTFKHFIIDEIEKKYSPLEGQTIDNMGTHRGEYLNIPE